MAQIALSYSAAQVDAAIAKINSLVSVIEGNIVQLYNGSTAIYPLTKAEAVFFDGDTSKTLDEQFSQLEQGVISLNLNLGFDNLVIYNQYYDTNGNIQEDPNGIYRRLPLIKCFSNRNINFINVVGGGVRCYDINKNYLQGQDKNIIRGTSKITLEHNVHYIGYYWQKAEVENYYSSYIELNSDLILNIQNNLNFLNKEQNLQEELHNSYINFSNIIYIEDKILYNHYWGPTGLLEQDSNEKYRCLPAIKINKPFYSNKVNYFYSPAIRWMDKNGNLITSIGLKEYNVPPADAVEARIYWQKTDDDTYSDVYFSTLDFLAYTNFSNFNSFIQSMGYQKNPNIFQEELCEEGYLEITGSIRKEGSGINYKTTNFISVKQGEPITIAPRSRFFMFFDLSKTPVRNTYIAEQNVYTFIPPYDGFIRASLYKDDILAKKIQIEYTDNIGEYNSPGVILNNLVIPQLNVLEQQTIENFKKIDSFNQNIEFSLGWLYKYIIYGKYYDPAGIIREDPSDIYRILPKIEVPDNIIDIKISSFPCESEPTARCFDKNGTFLGSSTLISKSEGVFHISLLENTKIIGIYWRKTTDKYENSSLTFGNEGSNINERLTRLENFSSANFNTEVINVKNSDKIVIIGDSYTESHYTVKGKAYINKLSLFSDFEFVNWGVSGDIYIGRLNSIRNGTNHYNSLSFKEIAPKYAMMCCYTNDTKYMGVESYIQCLDNICTVLVGLGVTPIICTEYHTGYNSQSKTNVKTALKIYAEKNKYLFFDIATYADLMRKDGFSSIYPPFWGGSHAGTRTNAIESDPYEMYLNGLENPYKSLKLFRYRNSILPLNLDDLLFRNNKERAKFFKEINVGHTYITNADEVDNCTNATQTKQTDEYQNLQRKLSLEFNNLCLVSCIIPFINKNVSDLTLNISGEGIENVYVLNNLIAPYNNYERYSRFDYTNLTNPPLEGTKYTDGTQEYTVVKVIEGIGDSGSQGSIFCTPSVINGNSGGVLTKVSGVGDNSINYSYKAIGYNIDNIKDTCGHWQEIIGNNGIYKLSDFVSCIEYDKVNFLIKGTNIAINDIFVECQGSGLKNYKQNQIELNYNLNNPNEELLPANTFSTPGTMDPNYNLITENTYEGNLGYDIYPKGCNSIIKVTNSNILNCIVDKSKLKEFKNKAYLEIWCRYFPNIYINGQENQITEDSFDYNYLNIEIGSNNNYKTTFNEIVNTHWKILRLPIIIDDNEEDIEFNIYSNSYGIEITYLSFKYE